MISLLKTIWNAAYSITFRLILIISSVPARLGWDRLVMGFMRLNARVVLLMLRGKQKSDVKEMGDEWKRMFPTEKFQEFLHIENETYYARTHVWCPLRGTGDVRACHHLMEFDRTLVDAIGGQFIVLTSQAQAGETTCTIAIRGKGAPVDDLVPAYRK
jgi:hypothetical protein